MEIYTACWDTSPCNERRAVAVFCHGLTSHVHNVEYEENLYRHLSAAGIAVFAYDKRGHGRTGEAAEDTYNLGEGDLRMWDLSAVIMAAKAKFPNAPLYLVGHSLGAADCLAYLVNAFAGKGILRQYDAKDHVKGVVAIAPYLGHNDLVNSLMVSLMAKLAPSTTVEFDKADLSKDAGDLGLTVEETEDIFRKYDTSGSGKLEKDELLRAFNDGLKLGLTEEDIDSVMERFDDSKDGALSIQELIEHVSSHHTPDEVCSL
jgi:pimeloyl-ACP methyl ester carboxylesterase